MYDYDYSDSYLILILIVVVKVMQILRELNHCVLKDYRENKDDYQLDGVP